VIIAVETSVFIIRVNSVTLYVRISVAFFIRCTLSPSAFYAGKQQLLSARLSHRNSVCMSVRHTGGSVKKSAS